MKAKRSLGQNFLVDPMLADRFVAELGVGPSERVLEIGPGRGALTERVLGVLGPQGRLRLVEKDDQLASDWRAKAQGDERLELLHGDALDLDLLDQGPWVVLGNLPYNLAGRIAMHLLAQRDPSEQPKASRMVLGFQREVAQRFVARPGDSSYNALSVLVAVQARTRVLFDLPPEAYRPQPKVWSQTVFFAPRPQAMVGASDLLAFEKLVHGAFTHRRKTLRKGLKLVFGPAAADWLEQAEIDPQMRPQDLSVEGFAALAHAQRGKGRGE